MIPKVIHYCWFGNNEKPKSVVQFIDDWSKKLPDYEIIEWNEGNFDFRMNPFAEEAYRMRKYAFVADYARLWALYNHGGIYLDTDVEILTDFGCYHEDDAFVSFESLTAVSTAVIGARKSSPFINDFLQYYNGVSFIRDDGSLNVKPNTEILYDLLKNRGLCFEISQIQKIKNYCNVYPVDYFCSKSFVTGAITTTKNSVCIHHFSGSWLSWDQKINHIFWKLIKQIKNVLIPGKRR